MKILVLGASGMLGFALHRVLKDSGFDVIGVVRSPLPPASAWCYGLEYRCGIDVRKIDDVLRTVRDEHATVVINATGVRSAGAPGSGTGDMLSVNAVFPRLMGCAAVSLKFHFIHFSSDGVFSGVRGMSDEQCLPDPADAYGVSKFLGEPGGSHALVFRTSLLGRGIEPNDSLVDWFLRQRGVVRGFRRAIFSGLPVQEIARIIATHVLPRPAMLTGLYHLSAEPITKYELLNLVREAWGVEDVRVEPEDSVAIDRSLDSRRFRSISGYQPPAWQDLIGEMYAFYSSLDAGRAAHGETRR